MKTFAPLNEQMELILRGVEEIIPVEELEKKITKSKKPAVFKIINFFFKKLFIIYNKNKK
ncbi:MAG: hypothetical protein QF380_06825 [Candidatus Marinimicrobia bacterium]|nr:hypothetical protein [Candidatus Neomarinimicrobiota bacterium]